MDLVARLAERRLLAAVAEGKLSHLAGEGRALPDRITNPYVQPEDEILMHLMAESGYLPEELVQHKRLAELYDALRASHDPAERRALLAQIADAEMREGVAHDTRVNYLRHK